MSEIREKISLRELTEPQSSAAPEVGYDSWKDEKIRKALKQSEDRSSMISAREVWARFGFER